ncbi:MAG: TolC family protein [Pseudomonadota bacterium]
MTTVAAPAYAQHAPSDRSSAAAAAGESVSAARQTGTPLTLAQAIEQALANHPDLAAARHDVEAARGATDQAGLLPNPELAASVEDTRRATRTTAIQINQRLELGGKRGARVEAARLAQDAAEARLDARRAGVRADVQTAYWEVMTGQERLDLARQSRLSALQAVDAASKRVTAGKVSPVEETRARLALSSVDVEAAQAEQELQAARAKLGVLVGLPNPQVLNVPVALDALGGGLGEQEMARRLEQAPDILLARLEVRRRESVVELERSRAVPDVTVGFGTQRNNELGRNQTLLGLSVPLPLFDRNQGNLREALARADQSREELLSTQRRVAADVRIALSQLDNARRQALLVERQMLPDAQRTYDAAREGFSLGKFGFLDVLDAQRTLFQARALHLRALSDTLRAAAEIDRLTGEPIAVPGLSSQ